MVIWIVLGILLIIYLGPKAFNILGQTTSGDFQTVLFDQHHGFVFTPDSALVNVECPGIGKSGDLSDKSCGGDNIIWVDDKVYSCGANSIEFLSISCNALSIYPQYKLLCDAPNRRADGTVVPEQPVCSVLSNEFGTISNPLSVGDHQWEYFGMKVYPGNERRIIHDIKTVTVTDFLQCGDNICSVERQETHLNCPSDCPPPECNDGQLNGNEQGVDCGGQCSIPCDNQITCVPEYVYEEWISCKNGVQSRGYADNSHCGRTPDEPLLRGCINENPSTKGIITTSLGAFAVAAVIAAVIFLWWILKKRR